MAQHNLSKIVDDNGDEYLIKAKGLESQIQIALSGDVTGSATTDLSGNVTISSTIANGAVTHSKLATDSVQNDVIKDGEITKSKFNASVYDETNGSIADGTNSNLATKTQVKAYVESVVSSEGHYKGVQSVTTINSWTASNLHNGDRVITSSEPSGSGTGTLTLGNLPVVDGQEVIFYVSDDQSVKIWQSSEGNYKIKQTAVSDPTASGTTLTAIATISQNANGEITATKKTIQDGTTSQKGVVQLTDSHTSTSTTTAATPKNVKEAYDLAAGKQDPITFDGTYNASTNKAATVSSVTSRIAALDAEVTSSDGSNVQVKVTETDGKITAVNITTDNTASKVASATEGNFAGLDANGNLTDSGSKASDFATAAQGAKADSAIQSVKVDGTALTPDENKAVNIDLANAHVEKADQLNTARNIDGVSFNGTANIHHYGTCSTAAGTAAKAVTLSNSMSFTLAAGAKVYVKFSEYNSAANATLNVNGTGAKSIYKYGSTAPGTSAKTSWYTGSVVCFIYDGTAWQMVGWLNDDTTYSNASLGQGYGTCATDEATAAKTVTLSSYSLATGGIVAVKFTYGLCASATMNINSKGAKNIYIHGAAATATTCKEVLAGDIAHFIYDGTYYHLLGTDHAERKFSINYRSSDNALVFTKTFGTTT